jgi:quinol monooxygenase YgiN
MADHVSFFRARTLPGKAQAVAEQMDKWQREQKPQAKGFVRSILVTNNDNPDEIMGAVRWDSSEGYFANAGRPEQDAWYREFRALMAADPEWFDGTLLRETNA